MYRQLNIRSSVEGVLIILHYIIYITLLLIRIYLMYFCTLRSIMTASKDTIIIGQIELIECKFSTQSSISIQLPFNVIRIPHSFHKSYTIDPRQSHAISITSPQSESLITSPDFYSLDILFCYTTLITAKGFNNSTCIT